LRDFAIGTKVIQPTYLDPKEAKKLRA
jgi:hypothetical protein